MTRRLLSFSDLHEMGIPLSAQSIRSRVRQGTFPKPIALGQKRVWIDSEINAWIDKLAKKKARRVGQTRRAKRTRKTYSSSP